MVALWKEFQIFLISVIIDIKCQIAKENTENYASNSKK